MPKVTNSRITIDASEDLTSFGASIVARFEAVENNIDELLNIFGATEDADDLDVDDIACGTITCTDTSASSLTVGANGATNPVLKVDASTSSVATGISITGAAAAGGVAVAAISSGTNESLTIDAKGAGVLTLQSVGTGGIVLGDDITITNGKNIVTSVTTGTKIGTATTNKIGFWNATPVAQQADSTQGEVTTSVTTTATTTNLKTTVAAMLTLLNRLRLDLVTTGIIKGAAA
jgi:hypothetical protein